MKRFVVIPVLWLIVTLGVACGEEPRRPFDAFALGDEITYLHLGDGTVDEIRLWGPDRAEAVLKVPPFRFMRRPTLSSPTTVDLLIAHEAFDAVWRLSIGASGEYEVELLWTGLLRSLASPQVIDPEDPSRFLLYEDPSRGHADWDSKEDAVYLVQEGKASRIPLPPREDGESHRILGVGLARGRIQVSTVRDIYSGRLLDTPPGAKWASVEWETVPGFPPGARLPIDSGWVGFIGREAGPFRFDRIPVVFTMQGEKIEELDLEDPAPLLVRFGNGVVAYNLQGEAIVFSGGRTYRMSIPPGILLIDSLAGSRTLAWDRETRKAWWIDIPPPPGDQPAAEEAEPPVAPEGPDAEEAADR